MAKAAALKKVDQSKSSARKPAKPLPKPTAKKPQLKVVKPSAKPVAKQVAKKQPVKKPIAKAVAKPAVKAPVKKPAAKVQAKPQAAPVAKFSKPVARLAKPAAVAPAAKPLVKKDFTVGCYVVYPTHGVGRITAEETQQIGDVSLKMFVISFEKDRMTLRVPVHRASAAGLRHISGNDQMQKVFVTLKGRARTSRGMWSRRAQEYEAKINSGNILSIAEVVRDLHHNVDQAERSYSERMIYESALGRLVGELAAAESSDHKTATDKLLKLLRGRVAA